MSYKNVSALDFVRPYPSRPTVNRVIGSCKFIQIRHSADKAKRQIKPEALVLYERTNSKIVHTSIPPTYPATILNKRNPSPSPASPYQSLFSSLPLFFPTPFLAVFTVLDHQGNQSQHHTLNFPAYPYTIIIPQNGLTVTLSRVPKSRARITTIKSDTHQRRTP